MAAPAPSRTIARAKASLRRLTRVFRAPERKTNELFNLLKIDPRPLIYPPQRLIVIFSPKAACTSISIWFFHQIGLAAEARNLARFPHAYRRVYHHSPLYKSARHADLSEYSVIRIIRDPFDRAVSAFRHVLRTRYAEGVIAKTLRRDDIATAGLSFSEFLDFLETCDMTTCDQHFRIQRHPLEDHLPTRHLINISTENLFVRLNQVEADLGMPITDFDKLDWLHELDDVRSHGQAISPATDAYDRRFDWQCARSDSWPSYAAFLTPPARERIARLYAVDIAAYGTAPVRPRNHQPELMLTPS